MEYKSISILLWILAGTGLVLTVLPSILVFKGALHFETHLTLMTIGMLMWFGGRTTLQYLSDHR